MCSDPQSLSQDPLSGASGEWGEAASLCPCLLDFFFFCKQVFLVTTYKSGSIITSALKKHKMSCFGCCEENDNNRTAASGGPYVASHSAGKDT